jgi:fumarylacetoacetase
LIELSRRGSQPIALPDGTGRSFLLDGDELAIRGYAGSGAARISLGEVRGTVAPVRSAAR